MKNYNIFLDDERYPIFIKDSLGELFPSDWIVVRDYFEFTKFIDQNFDQVNIISFDHDLACYDKNKKEWTGKDAVNYVIDICVNQGKKFPNWYVHTKNTSGRENIISSILNYMKHIENKELDYKYYNNGFINNKTI